MRELGFLGRGVRAIAVLITALVATLSLQTTSALAGPALPSQDPFYAWSTSLSGVANGTVLRTRTIPFEVSGADVPVTATQVLYRTTSELGQPTVAVATVVKPLAVSTGKIVSYQWAYDGLAGRCEPSYAIQGGTPTENTNPDEQDLMVPLLAAGETVVTADYESEDNDFAAGREEGQITLDGILATENLLSMSRSTQVALMGYSGGAIASDWASELAPSYAPTVNIVGTAMGGIAVDLAHNLSYVNGSQEWSGAIPAALVGIARAFHIDLSTYLSSYGLSITDKVGDSCLSTDDLGSFPGLTYQKLLKPQYTNIDQIPDFVNALNTLIMGTGGVPEEPMYMGIGNDDGKGDDVMVLADDEALANKYCSEGLPVEFNIYKGDDHGDAGTAFLPQADSWVIGRLLGAQPMDECGRIPAGDSLAPLTADPLTTTSATSSLARVALQYRNTIGRTVHVRVKATNRTVKSLTVRLLGPAGATLALKRVNAVRGKLVNVSLTAPGKLNRGSYRITVRSGNRLIASRSFSVK